MTDKEEAQLAKVQLANELAEEFDADLFLFNYEIFPPADFAFMAQVAGRERRKNVILFLLTEGGSADSAFRMMRFLQGAYERVTVAVPSWCKSAGTLMAIGGHELHMGNLGELGPLDVQIVKADEMDEQKSGLVAEAAFEKLQQEAFKFFMGFVRDIGGSEYRVTLKTASDIATKMTIGVVQPIFDKLEPVTIGEDFRSNRLAQAYAERLNMHSKNLQRSRNFDALENLLSGYPSHGFVIDIKEASNLFKNVKPLAPKLVELLGYLGADGVIPRSRRQEQNPRLEYLNDQLPEHGEESAAASAPAAPAVEDPEPRPRSGRQRDRAADVQGPPEEGSPAEQVRAAKTSSAFIRRSA